MVNTRGVRVKWLRTNNHDTTWRARKGGDRCDDVMSEIQDGVISLKLATKLSRAVFVGLGPLVPIPKLARVQSTATDLTVYQCTFFFFSYYFYFFLENPTIFISSYKNMFSHIVRTDWRWFMKIKGIEQWKKERKNEEFGKYNNVNKCENNS